MIRPSVPTLLLWALAFVGILLVLGQRARAHTAGEWDYPDSCCGGRDCRLMPRGAVEERPSGYLIIMSGQIVGYRDKRLRRSPDGEFHLCTRGGADLGETICLFVPPQGT